MNPVSWVKSKSLVYAGMEVEATTCVVLLLAMTVMRISSAIYEPGVDTTLVAVVSIFLAIIRN